MALSNSTLYSTTPVARSEGDAPEIDGKVFLRDAAHLNKGDIVKVTVEDADDYDLYAVPVAQ